MGGVEEEKITRWSFFHHIPVGLVCEPHKSLEAPVAGVIFRCSYLMSPSSVSVGWPCYVYFDRIRRLARTGIQTYFTKLVIVLLLVYQEGFLRVGQFYIIILGGKGVGEYLIYWLKMSNY